jgi:hypothetical protein
MVHSWVLLLYLQQYDVSTLSTGVLPSMIKARHPSDRAERRKLNEAKKNNRDGNKRILPRPDGALPTVSPDELESN